MSRISENTYTIQTATEQKGTYTKSASQAAEHIKKSGSANEGEQRKTVFAGAVMPGTETIMEKLQQAREKAWKVVSDVWGSDIQTDEKIAEIEQHKEEMLAELGELQQKLRENKAGQEELRKTFEVDVNSQEYQDLLLLKKEQDFRNGVSFDMPTFQEQERLAGIKKQPLTEYQTMVLQRNEYAAKLKKDIQTAKDWLSADAENIQSIRLERLKSDPMTEAKKEAETIMETAAKEAVSAMLEEGKEQVEEKLDEAKEEAKEKAKEQEKKEEIREEIELERAIKQAFVEGTVQAAEEVKQKARRRETIDVDTTELLEMSGVSAGSEQVAQSLAELKANMKVLEADLKGIKVDEEI